MSGDGVPANEESYSERTLGSWVIFWGREAHVPSPTESEICWKILEQIICSSWNVGCLSLFP